MGDASGISQPQGGLQWQREKAATKRLGAGTSSHPHYTHSTNSDQVADTSLETHICGNILWSRQEMLHFWATQASLSDAQANSTQGSTRVGVNRCLDAQHPQNCISLLSQKFFSTTRCAPYFCSRCCRWQAISWKSREVLTVVFFFLLLCETLITKAVSPRVQAPSLYTWVYMGKTCWKAALGTSAGQGSPCKSPWRGISVLRVADGLPRVSSGVLISTSLPKPRLPPVGWAGQENAFKH